MTDERQIKLPHSLKLEDRKKLTVSGVCDIAGYDEQAVTAITDLGELCIRGSELKINKMSVDSGELLVEGNISSISYSERADSTGSFFGRLFR